jgi:CAAX prenyl protease-like protein
MAVVAAAMLSGALSTGFDYFYPLRVVAAVTTLWIFRGAFRGIRWALSWQAILIGGATAVMWLALTPGVSETAALPLQLAGMSFGWASVWFLFRTVGYVITAPVAEELAFRGYLSRRIISADFLNVPSSRLSWMSLAVSAGLFAAVHGRNWLPGLLAGILFFWAFRRCGRILDAIQAHITCNAVITFYVLITGNWAKWS